MQHILYHTKLTGWTHLYTLSLLTDTRHAFVRTVLVGNICTKAMGSQIRAG